MTETLGSGGGGVRSIRYDSRGSGQEWRLHISEDRCYLNLRISFIPAGLPLVMSVPLLGVILVFKQIHTDLKHSSATERI